VVVGVHGTPASRGTVAWVAKLRELGPVDARLVHFYWPPTEANRFGIHDTRDPLHGDPQIADALERELEPLRAGLTGPGKVTLDVRPAWGSVARALCGTAAEEHADLLVLATHRRSGLERLRLGATLQPTLHAATVPVLCVPTRESEAEREAYLPRFRKILVATDFSELANQAVPYAFGLLGEARGLVILCHVHQRSGAAQTGAYGAPGAARLTEDDERELRLRLQRLIPAEAEARSIPTDVVIVDGGEPAEAINQAANRCGVDAIVMASHGRSGLARALLGSVAQAVVQKAERPVLIVRPRTR
jgi:nucleotide-binding universal stress UspA family protein